nr:hypothetical protein [Bacilli bacterium]
MEDYIYNFDTVEDLREYINTIYIKKLGSGADGVVYQTVFDEAIKMYKPELVEEYKPGLYVMESDINLDSFIFPRELLTCNGKVYGYRMELFRNNVFNQYDKTKKIDLTNVEKARKIFINDALILTDKGYKLVDLPDNLLFDNEVFKAIDTPSYIKSNESDLKEKNLKLIDRAILCGLDPFTDYRNIVDIDFEESFEKIKNMQRR